MPPHVWGGRLRSRSDRSRVGKFSSQKWFGQLQIDSVNRVVQRLIDIAHRDAKYAIAPGLQIPRLAPVLLIIFMPCAVDLNRESFRNAHEVDDVRTDGNLAPKLVASNLSPA
jgi:hypothetical protein